MRDALRFALGVAVGGTALTAYLLYVGPAAVANRATAVAPWALAAVSLLLFCEASADGIGVWASMRPLGDGITPSQSVQFTFAGDFFDTLSPAGPVSSEPIMARFFAVATDTTYSEALGVRGLAKYVKSAVQLLVSTALFGLLVVSGVAPTEVALTLAGAAAAVLLFGVLFVSARAPLSRVFVAVTAPIVTRVSMLYREEPHDRSAVAAAVDRLWSRALYFSDAPRLLALIAVGGVLEQLLTAGALYVALVGAGASATLLPIVAVIPLLQVASVIPIPASLGVYDLLLAGALVVVAGVALAPATAAVLVARLVALSISLGVGGVATALLRGWRP